MKQIFCPLIFLVVFDWSCSSPKTSETNTDELVLIQQNIANQAPLKTSTVIDDFEYIVLETTEESLIGGIEKVIISDGHIFIIDNRHKKLLIFGLNGKFITSINPIGRGPKELQWITDFSIYNKQIWIADGWKMLIYDINGSFRGVLYYRNGEADRISMDNMEVNKNGIYLYNGYESTWNLEKNSLMYLMDHKLLSEKHAYNILYNDEIHYADMMTSGHCLSKHDDGVLFYKFFNDTVYHLRGDGSMKKYAYDFGSASFSYDERKRLKRNNTKMYDIKNHVQGIYKTFLSDDYLLTCFFYNTKHLWHYKNFETGESRLFTEFIDDLDTKANFFHFFEDKGNLISYIPAFILAESDGLDPDSKLGKLKSQVSSDSNPIMVVCTFK